MDDYQENNVPQNSKVLNFEKDMRDLPEYDELRVNTGQALRIEQLTRLGSIVIKNEVKED